ncbi:hypothetical protein BDW22DRAFT_1481563 [Trametopsis cervina]|nr:hypothetical protein BDW22DRAFT_1481563 [Trametopsis cervina]
MSAANSLCLACSSSLPPRASNSGAGKDQRLFITACCARPICPSCLSSNPRLARYNPCLHCLAGVDLVNAGSSVKVPNSAKSHERVNVDGGVHDEDVFTLGEDDEDDADINSEEGSLEQSTPPPAYDIPLIIAEDKPLEVPQADTSENPPSAREDLARTPAPSKHYIQPKDTLVGIAFKYKVDGRFLCRLNNLPQSTLRTTPHLLHTRTELILPPSAFLPSTTSSTSAPTDPEYAARRARERAEKRLQTLTKETDWRVAKAYVALADPEVAEADGAEQWKEAEGKELKPTHVRPSMNGETSGGLEAAAIDRYLDDEEWERRQRQNGRGVSIPRFPLFETNVWAGGSGKKPASGKLFSGWKWN